MSILALETATEACSVAIILADGQVLSRYEYSPRLQTQLLLPMVDELLAEADNSNEDGRAKNRRVNFRKLN